MPMLTLCQESRSDTLHLSALHKDRTIVRGYDRKAHVSSVESGGTEIAAFTGKYRVKGIIPCVVQA
ncbi:MAG: hypothetical protein V3T60_13005, partial [Candidatus Binatia bacterium]